MNGEKEHLGLKKDSNIIPSSDGSEVLGTIVGLQSEFEDLNDNSLLQNLLSFDLSLLSVESDGKKVYRHLKQYLDNFLSNKKLQNPNVVQELVTLKENTGRFFLIKPSHNITDTRQTSERDILSGSKPTDQDLPNNDERLFETEYYTKTGVDGLYYFRKNGLEGLGDGLDVDEIINRLKDILGNESDAIDMFALRNQLPLGGINNHEGYFDMKGQSGTVTYGVEGGETFCFTYYSRDDYDHTYQNSLGTEEFSNQDDIPSSRFSGHGKSATLVLKK